MDGTSSPPTPSETSGFGRRLPAVVLVIALLCDLTLYRGHGFGGVAALFAGLPFLMALGRFQPRYPIDLLVVGGLTLAVAARTAWSGNPLLVLSGAGLLLAFAMTLSGLRPFLPDLLVFALHLPISGALELCKPREWPVSGRRVPAGSLLSVMLPAIALLIFGGLFTLANPSLRDTVAEQLARVSELLGSWFRNIGILEIWFWGFVIWLATGALRPLVRGEILEAFFAAESQPVDDRLPQTDLYPAYRNTLAAVALLFFVYLIFEFRTLWFREFPKGFHYSGYAHEGAFWLTVALALATLILSLMFRGPLLDDPRITFLRRLAWLWSAQNFLLALTAYHRLTIYIGFNGMTWMRFVGFYGITAVVLGLVLVLVKIRRRESFVWLVQRQLWVLSVVVIAFAVTPVDFLAMRYNVNRILAGDPAPSVQISVHSIDSEGLATLIPLMDTDNVRIRNGIHALLARTWRELSLLEERRAKLGWTTWQGAEIRLRTRLEAVRDRFRDFEDSATQAKAWTDFQSYAYDWY